MGTELVGHGVSLWLVPDEPEAACLREIIARLASRLGTPMFEPHVTLLAGLVVPAEALLERAEGLAFDLEPLSLPLQPPQGRTDAFRCLFLPVGETLRLLAAHALARAVYRRDQDPPFEPHLSLVYGTIDDDTKERVAAESVGQLPSRASFSNLDVVRTTGPVTSWRHIRRLPLGGPLAGQSPT